MGHTKLWTVLVTVGLMTRLTLVQAWLFNPHRGDRGDERQDDEIESLPGQPDTPSFKQYSGYLRANDGNMLHYWFVEHESSPSTAPVLLWLSGGPTCSSLDCFLNEHGPYMVNDDGKTLRKNDYSWNKIANMLYLETPVGVGYSYNENGVYSSDDDRMADDNHVALRHFFRKFPELRNNDFYVTGESYAGVYIPVLTEKLLKDNSINLKGMVITNGLLDSNLLFSTKLYYWAYHHYMSLSTWEELMSECCPGVGLDEICSFVPFRSRACQRMVSSLTVDIMMRAQNAYNVYAPCSGAPPSGQTEDPARASRQARLAAFLLQQTLRHFDDAEAVNLLGSTISKFAKMYDCVNKTAASVYMNQPGVRRATHIPYWLPKFERCSSTVSVDSGTYKTLYQDMRKQFLQILQAQKQVLVVNGDFDIMCDFLGDREFVYSLNQEELHPYTPWFFNQTDNTSQIGGLGTQFKNIAFMTMKAAGHYVPKDRPVPTLQLLSRFLNGQNLYSITQEY